MSTEPFIGQISMAGFNFPPRGWARCDGQLMSIAQNTALFSLIGIAYGGDGRTTFALPDLRGRVPVHQGQGPGMPPYSMGQTAGEVTHTLISTEMPMHNHLVNVTTADSSAKNPTGNFMGGTASPIYATAPNGNIMNPQALSIAGGSQPHNNMQPYQVVSFIIALQGIFPSRN